MQYFGVPRCPYCKKRVNLIRTWSLKRQGEYQCPRCGGISNIYLSPLVYVLALLAIFSGGAVYFFHKFVLDDIGLTTCLQVFVPFAAFFLLSLFLVYLEKPVIKRVSREEGGKKARARAGATGQVYVDDGEFVPNGRAPGAPVQSPAPRRVASAAQPTAVMPREGAGSQPRTAAPSPAAQRRQAAQRTAAQGGAVRRPQPQEDRVQSRVAPVAEPRTIRREDPQETPAWTTVQHQPAPRREAPQAESPRKAAPARDPSLAAPRRASHVVSSVEIPDLTEDFFKKYDDPSYVERRLKELQQGERQD